MKKSFSTTRLIGALVIGSLAGAAFGVLLANKKEGNTRREIVSDAKDIARNIRKKAQKKAKSINNEEWLGKEKEKIMNHVK